MDDSPEHAPSKPLPWRLLLIAGLLVAAEAIARSAVANTVRSLVVKQVVVLFRILFPPNDVWDIECATFLPKLLKVGTDLMSETGRAAGPVTDLATRLLKIHEEEATKQEL